MQYFSNFTVLLCTCNPLLTLLFTGYNKKTDRWTLENHSGQPNVSML